MSATARTVPPLPGENHDCASCGLVYPALTVDDAREIVAETPGAAAAALAELPSWRLRVQPDPGRWSPVEYLCHLRDVAIASTIRLYRARTEDGPVLEPMLNDLRATRFGYAHADPVAVLAELGHAAAGLLDEIARVRDWDRTVTRLPGERRTARWLVRHAAHEFRHHVADLRAAGTAAAIVRPRAEADIAVLAAILRDLHAREGYPIFPKRDMGEWLQAAPVLAAWVADQDGGPVGHVALSEPGPRSAVAAMVAEPAAVVTRLFVARDVRGQGLGERLVRAAEGEAAARGRHAVLEVLVRDTAAMALYERLGWRRIGTTVHRIAGTEFPAICLAAP